MPQLPLDMADREFFGDRAFLENSLSSCKNLEFLESKPLISHSPVPLYVENYVPILP